MNYAPEHLKVLVNMPRGHLKQMSGSMGGVCKDIYDPCKTLLSKQATKTIVDVGLPAGLCVIDLAELSLSSLSGSVSRDCSVMHQQHSPLWYL